MLCRIFQGSNPIAASTTPTRIDSRISRNATASGEPPRNRYRPSLLAGKSLTSLGIDALLRVMAAFIVQRTADGEPVFARQWLAGLRRGNAGIAFEHPFQRF